MPENPSHGKLILREFNEVQIGQRVEDDYFNATAMCKANGKEWSGYFRGSTTQAFISEIERSLQIHRDVLIQSTSTGLNEERGTWVHPYVAMHLAQWCSPEFAAIASEWLWQKVSGKADAAKMPTHVEALRGWADALEEKQKLEERVEHMQPYYDGAKRMQVAQGSIGIREAAARLKISQPKLTSSLIEWKLCYKDHTGRLRFHAQYGPQREGSSSRYFGYFDLAGNTQVWEDGRIVDRSYMRITPKGLEAIARKLGFTELDQYPLL